jgi:tellurite resistance protein TehA-like permease
MFIFLFVYSEHYQRHNSKTVRGSLAIPFLPEMSIVVMGSHFRENVISSFLFTAPRSRDHTY